VVVGLLAAIVLIANIVSFGALMFPGAFSAGASTAIWSMLIGGCIGGFWIAVATSLPPLTTGIDSPTGTVLVLLSAAVSTRVVATGGSTQAAVQTVMLLFTAATVVTGAALYALGALRWGSYFRFVPSCVVAGFLTATGAFLIGGGTRMTLGRPLDLGNLAASVSAGGIARLLCAAAALTTLLAVRRFIKAAFILPAALVAMWLGGALVLRAIGLSGAEDGWYFPALGVLAHWSPLEAARTTHLTWPGLVRLVPELLAVTAVALISLVTKVSSIELARQAAGDLDREFRAHGIGSLVSAPFGGLTTSLQVGTSQLADHAGGATRWSGAVCALALGAVGVAGINLEGAIPIPLVAGLVFYLGYTFIVDSLRRLYAQRAWLDVALALGIAVVCVRYGYLIGVLAGLLCACMLFVISYARLGVVSRQMSRAQFASHVDRSAEAARRLRENGDAIQIYWLSGYIFFGSSESVFERIRSDIAALAPRQVDYVILDFGLVSGADSSAIVSLAKLRSFCDQNGTTLVYCAMSPGRRLALERAGFFGGDSRHRAFADLNLALAWCEDRLLAAAGFECATGLADFEPWLAGQLGPTVQPADFVAYLERKDTAGAQVLYREGEAADTIDLVAAGTLSIDIARPGGESLHVRRITTHTVVGEMGFFRHTVRSATVSTEGPATLFTLTRASFERMRREQPALASAFDDFILRVLADRIDFANRGLAAMSR
jgi:SulP family sulfate permease